MKKATSSEEQRSQSQADITTGTSAAAPAIIPFNYQGQPVRFNLDGWLHATAIGAKFGKEPYAWLVSVDTVSYMGALAAALSTDHNSRFLQKSNKIKELDSSKASTKTKALKLAKAMGLVVTRAGSPESGGGTWLHPKLAVVFARWLSVDFAVWCDLHIDALLSSDPAVRRAYGWRLNVWRKGPRRQARTAAASPISAGTNEAS